MIPDQYWRLARRWFWLIGICGILGAIAGFYLLPSFIGSTGSFNSRAVMAVSQQAGFSTINTEGDVETDDTVVASYTEELATIAGTPQFITDVQAELAAAGISLDTRSINRMLEITANPTLFRVNVEAQAVSAALAETVATAATDALIKRAIAEETKLASSLIANVDRRRSEVEAQLIALDATKQLATSHEKFLATLEAGVLNKEFENLIRQREQLRFGQTFSLPLVVVTPPETVATDAGTLSARDLLLLGTLAGIVAGWGAANMAERIRPGSDMLVMTASDQAMVDPAAPPGNGHRTDDQPAYALSPQLISLSARAAAIERRLRDLDSSLPVNGHVEVERPVPTAHA